MISEKEYMIDNKIVNNIDFLKKRNYKLTFTNGVFDLLHISHINLLKFAKSQGDKLIVALNSDASVKRLKGDSRPIITLDERMKIIAALECVDFVAINKWPTAEETLKLIRPNIYVKGQEFEKLEDKTGKIQREHKVIQEIGAELRFTHEIVFSSTKLLNQYFNPQITQISTDTNQKKDERTYKIIGAAMEVHKEMGSGFLEAVYQEALGMELKNRGIPYKEQPVAEIFYKGKTLEKKYQPDFICFDEVIVEIKALHQLSGIEESQIINYLKATGRNVGLLINFGSKSLEYKRFIN